MGCGRPGCPSAPTILTIFLPRISRTASVGKVRMSVLLTAEIWTLAFIPGLRNGIFDSSVSVGCACIGGSSTGASSKNPPNSPPKSSSSVSSFASATSDSSGCCAVCCAAGSVGVWVLMVFHQPAHLPLGVVGALPGNVRAVRRSYLRSLVVDHRRHRPPSSSRLASCLDANRWLLHFSIRRLLQMLSHSE